MKKILSVVIAAIFAAGVFAQDNTPAMLKKKELFSKTELFDNSAIFSNAQPNCSRITRQIRAPIRQTSLCQ